MMDRSRKGTSKPTRNVSLPLGQAERSGILSIETLATGTQTSLSSDSDLNVQDDYGRTAPTYVQHSQRPNNPNGRRGGMTCVGCAHASKGVCSTQTKSYMKCSFNQTQETGMCERCVQQRLDCSGPMSPTQRQARRTTRTDNFDSRLRKKLVREARRLGHERFMTICGEIAQEIVPPPEGPQPTGPQEQPTHQQVREEPLLAPHVDSFDDTPLHSFALPSLFDSGSAPLTQDPNLSQVIDAWHDQGHDILMLGDLSSNAVVAAFTVAPNLTVNDIQESTDYFYSS